MSVNSEKVKAWRKRTKDRMVKAMGGKCVCCGYNKCTAALSFHHCSGKKELGFGKVMAHPVAWERLAIELKKCVLVCNNCHSEIHSGVTVVPNGSSVFDETYAFFDERKRNPQEILT